MGSHQQQVSLPTHCLVRREYRWVMGRSPLSLVMRRSPFSLLVVLASLLAVNSGSECELLGVGGCRGPGWSEGKWPLSRGRQDLDACCHLCETEAGCTSITVSAEGGCLLFGHQDVA